MNNKGQTTVLFSLIISVLFLFTLTALEVGRICMSKVKIKAVVHSTQSSIMADYHSELFERYHLLFLDPTYGTKSEAALEEKMQDYLEVSLIGEQGRDNGIYEFVIEEIAILEEKNILDDDMELLKNQITEYEKTAGIAHKAKSLKKQLEQSDKSDINQAAKETELNGVELPVNNEETSKENNEAQEETEIEVTDPRKTLSEGLKLGVLSLVLPAEKTVASDKIDTNNLPSKKYFEEEEKEKDTGFGDISFLKSFLKENAKDSDYSNLEKHAAMMDYTMYHFSNYTKEKEDCVLDCEVEYILKGKDNDYDNLSGVVNEIIWMRMPVNYAYLLTDSTKKGEALTMAAAICTATGTEAFIEVVKYLLLGCWAYGETICETRELLNGEKIAYVKTKENWCTDLDSLLTAKNTKKATTGLGYEDYLMLLLAKKNEKKLNACYARMLDVIGLNLSKEEETFDINNLVGEISFQGKISTNPMFMKNQEKEIYEYYFYEKITYE